MKGERNTGHYQKKVRRSGPWWFCKGSKQPAGRRFPGKKGENGKGGGEKKEGGRTVRRLLAPKGPGGEIGKKTGRGAWKAVAGARLQKNVSPREVVFGVRRPKKKGVNPTGFSRAVKGRTAGGEKESNGCRESTRPP